MIKEELKEFKYSADEEAAIQKALSKARPWDCETVGEIKKKIKEFHTQLVGEVCCYCFRDIHGEFSYSIDTEHILPKRHFKDLTFDIRNLSVACKRCNMKMKRDNLDFLEQPFSVEDIENEEKYKLVHPNLDDRDLHLERLSIQRNTKRIVKYVVLDASSKGDFNYSYFALHELEIESYDLAQDANVTAPDENATISKIRGLVEEIAESCSRV